MMNYEKMGILIVDDSSDVHNQLKVFLGKAGLKNLYFADSASAAYGILGLQEGMELNISVDLILMDIIMPNIDGIEATRRIKKVEKFQDVPVLMITGDSSKKSLQDAFKAGAVDYITKPLNNIELIARIRSFLKLKSEIDERKKREKDLEEALNKVKTLEGFIPICASCKKIRNDEGYWQQIESYISAHSDALFTHSLCPECANKFYKELEEYKKKKE